MLRNILAIIATLVVVFVVVGFLLPNQYEVERSIVIEAPVETVYAEVIDLKKTERWNPWIRQASDMELSYAETSSGAGASYSWTSEEMGSGKLTISKVEPLEKIETDLDFGDQGEAFACYTFEKLGPQKTKVTWKMFGDTEGNIIAAYVGLAMDAMAGPDFERGLANLKKVAEAKN